MLAQRLRRWSNIKTALFQHVVFVCTWIRHVMHSFNIYLITTIVLFNTFFYQIKSLLLETKCVFKQHDLQMFGHKLNKYA